jgi:hypothetical protein
MSKSRANPRAILFFMSIKEFLFYKEKENFEIKQLLKRREQEIEELKKTLSEVKISSVRMKK